MIPADFTLNDHGSIFILTPLSETANSWCDEYLPDDAQRWGAGYVVEPRYIEPIVSGIVADGMSIA